MESYSENDENLFKATRVIVFGQARLVGVAPCCNRRFSRNRSLRSDVGDLSGPGLDVDGLSALTSGILNRVRAGMQQH